MHLMGGLFLPNFCLLLQGVGCNTYTSSAGEAYLLGNRTNHPHAKRPKTTSTHHTSLQHSPLTSGTIVPPSDRESGVWVSLIDLLPTQGTLLQCQLYQNSPVCSQNNTCVIPKVRKLLLHSSISRQGCETPGSI